MFSLTPFLTFARFGRDAKDISFYWGPTYRLKNNFYNSFDISYEHYNSSCLRAYYRGYGIRLDNFNNDNFAISAKYFRSFLRRPGVLLTPYIGFSPVFFKMKSSYGLNIKPEIGIRFNTGALTFRQIVSFSLNVSYGYDIPILNETAFMVGRQDISAKFALSFNLNEIEYYCKARKLKNKEVVPKTDGEE
jgi:hypothetical protein